MRTSTLESNPQATTAYDYDRQCWLQRDGQGWRVLPCGHPEAMQPGCCYAGSHAGQVVVHHEGIH